MTLGQGRTAGERDEVGGGERGNGLCTWVLAQATIEGVSSCADGGAEAAGPEVASGRQRGPKGLEQIYL